MSVDVEAIRARLVQYSMWVRMSVEDAEALLDEIVALRERVAELEPHAYVPPLKCGQHVKAQPRIDAFLAINEQSIVLPGATGVIVRGWMAYKDDAPRYAYEVDFNGVVVTIMDRHIAASDDPTP